jgi:hypothetical protein
MTTLEDTTEREPLALGSSEGLGRGGGYWCVVCGRMLPSDDGVIVHDDVPHPDTMTFDEEDRPQ